METPDFKHVDEGSEIIKNEEVNKMSKAATIPQEWKDDIDNVWNRDLVDANRYYSATNQHLSELINEEIQKRPTEYLEDLISRWNWHNHFYENLLEPAIQILLPKESVEITPVLVEKIKEVYKTVTLVDRATLVTTAGIKKHVEYWIDILKAKGELSADDVNTLITPPNKTYLSEYTSDHLEYITVLRDDPEKSQELKLRLLDKYHLNDEKIFEGRFKYFKQYTKQSDEQIREKIDQLKIDENEKVKNFYLTVGKPDLRAISRIIAYDNIDEPKISMDLIGSSGLILRKKVLEYLNETKIIPNKGGVYSIPDDDVLEGLSKLAEYRGTYSEKKVTHYQQTGDTCGACCAMMVTSYFGITENSKNLENDLAQSSSSKLINGNHFSGLALQLVKDGLDTKLVHSENDMFKNEGYFTQDLFDSLMSEYTKFLSDGVKMGLKVENGAAVDSKEIKKMLVDGSMVILAGKLGNILHSVLIIGYSNNKFIVNDPLKSKTSYWTSNQTDNFLDTKIGKWMIVVNKNTKSLDRLIENLPEYNNQSKEMLSLRS